MQREIRYDNIEAFLAALRSQGVEKIAFAETNEKRPLQVSPGVLEVTYVEMVDLIAYRGSVLYKCSLRSVDRDALHERLASEGFEVTRRSRNIT